MLHRVLGFVVELLIGEFRFDPFERVVLLDLLAFLPGVLGLDDLLLFLLARLRRRLIGEGR